MEKIYIDMLTQDSVSFRKQQFITVDGKEYPIGDPWRRAYVNSISGRQQVNAEVPDPYRSVIILMWGENPTVTEVTE
jgi:hypothetical protein